MTCRHLPRTGRIYQADGGYTCTRCGTTVTRERQRQGRTVRQYGIRAELDAARKYGGVKTNDGGPVDIEGADWDTQMRTRRREPPKEWVKVFAAMPGRRLRRMLIRFVRPGHPPEDYYIVPSADWLSWYGRDE
jgi:hypothetical protein